MVVLRVGLPVKSVFAVTAPVVLAIPVRSACLNRDEDANEPSAWSADPTLRFDHVHVLESLPSNEGYASRTGRRLVEELEDLHTRPRFQLTYHAIETADALRLVLQSLVNEAHNGRFPLVHLEAHGEMRSPGKSSTSRGMVLANGELFRWSELSPYLANINRVTRLRMVVFVATCFGADIATLWQPMQPAPARVMLGPKDSILVSVLERGTFAFYRNLLTTFDGRQALAAMNEATDDAFWDFTAEWMFLRILEAYFNQRCNPSQVAARVETSVVAPLLLKGAPAEVINFARRRGKALLSDPKPVFEECYRTFFMIDKHPENQDRFRMTFESCFGVLPGGDANGDKG